MMLCVHCFTFAFAPSIWPRSGLKVIVGAEGYSELADIEELAAGREFVHPNERLGMEPFLLENGH